MVKTTAPINDYAFWEFRDGQESKSEEEYTAQVVRYWAHQMLTVHGRRIPLTEPEVLGKAKDMRHMCGHPLASSEEVKEYIDWFMNDYDAAVKQWAWRWLVDETFLDRFMCEEKGASRNALGYYVDEDGNLHLATVEKN